MPPPIRYPLPTLLALALLSLVAWRGEAWTRGWRSDWSNRFRRAVEGPPVPSSSRPRVVAGPIVRRALLLGEETVASSRPGGPASEKIERRMFVDVYDTWPSPGPVTHIRVGNRSPIGWIKASEALLWNTRLVVRVPGGKLTMADAPGGAGLVVDVGRLVLPVVAWEPGGSVEVAVWDEARPWSALTRTGWVRGGDLPTEAWGVWISQSELPNLLQRAIEGGDPALVRLSAVLGLLSTNRRLTPADLGAARPALPPVVFSAGAGSLDAAGKLAEANARPSSDAGWSGLTFRFLPLGDLP